MNATMRQPQDTLFTPNMNRLLDEFFRRAVPRSEGGEEDVVQSTWTPAVDVKETPQALTLFVELPGISKDAIDISLEQNVLTVHGERRLEDDRDAYHRVERVYGKFSRSFRLPRDVNGSGVTASYTDGVLRLELPKVAAAQPRQIKIK